MSRAMLPATDKPWVSLKSAARGLPAVITTRRKRATAGPLTAGFAPAMSPRSILTAASKLLDRSKDLVKSGGEWISSVDLENTLMSHPAVREAGVIAVQHPKWQERPLAVVALKDGAKATADDLRTFLSTKFAKWQMPTISSL